MVIDSSALVAILRDEPEGHFFLELIAADPIRKISAAALVETSMVALGARGGRGLDAFEALVDQLSLEIVPLDAAQARNAGEAFRRFGKGRHPAALNFGDCLCYALCQATGEPLLFKGDDFARTDLWRVA